MNAPATARTYSVKCIHLSPEPKHRRTDKSTERLRVIFRSRSLVIYNLNEVITTDTESARVKYIFGISVLCPKEHSIYRRNRCILFNLYKVRVCIIALKDEFS